MTLAHVAILADSAAKCYKVYAPSDATLTQLLKTENFYQRVMWKAVLQLYNGDMTRYDFESTMIDLIQGQLRRAWNEGMRSLELDPKVDQTNEGEDALQAIMVNELAYVDPLADEILAAAAHQDSVDQFRSRVDLWVNRYPDVVNQAIYFYAEREQRLKWELGATEQHCETCYALNGMIAFVSDWEQSGFHPQQPPNSMLSCGGWKCDCSLNPTDARRSRDALTRLLDIATARNL